MNTRINYLYRDANNYKVNNSVIIPGTFTHEQIMQIIESLDEGLYFQPNLVGLPEKRFKNYDPEVDHPWFELEESGFSETAEGATLCISPEELVRRFTDRPHCPTDVPEKLTHQMDYAPNRSITMILPDDPMLAQVISSAFCQRHDAEGTFPIGCKVLVTLDTPTLAVRLAEDMNMSLYAANGIAEHLKKDPSEIIGIQDLQDKDGKVKTFASLMDNIGHMYLVNINDVRRVDL